MAALKESVWEQGVLPILVTGAPFIGITTLGDEQNYVSQLAQIRDADTGRHVINVISMPLACERCMMRGVGADCVHIEHIMPHWHSAPGHRRIQQLMRSSRETYSRETRGIQANERDTPAFPEKAIERLALIEHAWDPRDSFDGMQPPRHVFVGVDPSGGGQRSQFALVSGMLYQQQFVLLGAESMLGGGPIQHGRLVARHIRELARQRRELRDVVFVLVPESNMSFVGGEVANHTMAALAHVYQAPSVTVLTENRGEHIGVRTTNDTKVAGALALRTLLLENRVRVHRNFLCTGAEPDDNNNQQQQRRNKVNSIADGREMLTELVRQLRAFRRIVKPPPQSRQHDPDAQPTITYSGKVSASSGFDDHVIATMIVCSIAPTLFYKNEYDYRPYSTTTPR